MAIAQVTSGKNLAESICNGLGVGLEFVAEIYIYFQSEQTIVYIWYSNFHDKEHDRFIFGYNPDFSDSLCKSLGIMPENTMRVSLTIPNQGVVSGEVTAKLTMIATKKVSELDWSKAFTKGASVVCNDSTVARKDIDETVDIKD